MTDATARVVEYSRQEQSDHGQDEHARQQSSARFGETLTLAIEPAGDDGQPEPQQAGCCNGSGDLGVDNLHLPAGENE